MTWFTDEQVRDAAIALYAVDIGFPASMKKIAAMFDALLDDEPAWYMAKAHSALSAVNPYEWRDIATAPKDGTEFLTIQNGEIYHTRYCDPDSANPRLTFRTHSLDVAKSYLNVDVEHEGETRKALLPIGEPWKESFRHSWTLWTRGFDFSPTHWKPLVPTSPQEGK